MIASIEISLYPLSEEYKETVKDFIRRLQAYEFLDVRPNGMSTQVFGPYEKLMEVLTKEMKEEFLSVHSSMFMLKIGKGNLSDQPEI